MFTSKPRSHLGMPTAYARDGFASRGTRRLKCTSTGQCHFMSLGVALLATPAGSRDSLSAQGSANGSHAAALAGNQLPRNIPKSSTMHGSAEADGSAQEAPTNRGQESSVSSCTPHSFIFACNEGAADYRPEARRHPSLQTKHRGAYEQSCSGPREAFNA